MSAGARRDMDLELSLLLIKVELQDNRSKILFDIVFGSFPLTYSRPLHRRLSRL